MLVDTRKLSVNTNVIRDYFNAEDIIDEGYYKSGKIAVLSSLVTREVDALFEAAVQNLGLNIKYFPEDFDGASKWLRE